MQTISCAECMESMAPVQDEFLTRIACANCQQAKESLAAHDRRQQRERPWGAGGEALRRQEIPGAPIRMQSGLGTVPMPGVRDMVLDPERTREAWGVAQDLAELTKDPKQETF